MNWASWTLIILAVLSVIVAIGLNGMPYPFPWQKGKRYNGVITLVCTILELILIYFSGGFQ